MAAPIAARLDRVRITRRRMLGAALAVGAAVPIGTMSHASEVRATPGPV
ncbi:hypothetical protein FHR38_002405 [Micromonospora polyrhachis]|uniref:Uncharacterized protein n=1 Tax=Micromonospora polyrhachis TaxID=1282883 RepID=A0A7W7SPQ2_9ACTN|nr:hypothetical protein [Micromonospora polyrhachis]